MNTDTLANGLKAVFGTSKTTASYLPTCTSNGSPEGFISAANLASTLGVSKNICRSVTMDNASKLKQKFTINNSRSAFIILYTMNGGGEGIIECTYLRNAVTQIFQAKYLISRGTSVPTLYYSNDSNEIGIYMPEIWGNYTIFGNTDSMDTTATVVSDFTGFTQATIQETPALNYGSLSSLASALGGTSEIGIETGSIASNTTKNFDDSHEGLLMLRYNSGTDVFLLAIDKWEVKNLGKTLSDTVTVTVINNVVVVNNTSSSSLRYKLIKI